MDGGGRFAQPLRTGSPGRAVARAAVLPTSFLPALPGLPFPNLPWGRRSGRLVAVPVASRLPRFLGTGLVAGFYAVVGIVGLVQGGHLAAWEAEHGAPHHGLARALGLGIDHVKMSGLDQLREAEVLAAAGIDSKVSLAFLDAADVRARLERVPLVKTASVRKLYPNELVITVTERTPHAIWQQNGELFIVATDGTALDRLEDAHFAHLPFVVGEQANTRTKEYLALLEAAGPIKGRIRAGTLVSGRRWTLKMDNGLDVRLPEQGAADALARLVKLQREQGILDKDVIAVDLRMADRVVVRLTEEAALARAEIVKKRPVRGSKGLDT